MCGFKHLSHLRSLTNFSPTTHARHTRHVQEIKGGVHALSMDTKTPQEAGVAEQ
jgi:hypothetical protein